MRGPSLVNIRHRRWAQSFLGILLSIHAVSAAPLHPGGRGSWSHQKIDPLERRQDQVEGQLYDGSSMIYATELPTGPVDQTPTTTSIVLLVPSTSAEAVPILTSSQDTTTSTYAAPTSSTSETSTSTESTEILPGETHTSSSTVISMTTSVASTSSSELTSSGTSPTIGGTSMTSDMGTDSTPISATPTSSVEGITVTSTTSSVSAPEAFAPTSSSDTSYSTMSETTTSTDITSETFETSLQAYDTGSRTSESLITAITSSVGDLSTSTSSFESTATSSVTSESQIYERPTSNPFNVPGFVTIPLPPSPTGTSTSLMSTSESSSESTPASTTATAGDTTSSALTTPMVPVPTGTPEFGPGFSFIGLPGQGGDSSSSSEPKSSASDGVALTSSLGFGNTMSATTTTSQIYNMPSVTTSVLDDYTTESPLPTVELTSTSSSLAAFLTTTSELVSSSTSLPEVITSSSITEMSSSTSSQFMIPSSTPETTSSTSNLPEVTEPAIPVETDGVPDILLPSSSPEGYAPYPTDGSVVTTVTSTESEPISTTSTSLSSTSSDIPPAEPSPELPSDAITGAPPDLVLPTTTSSGFGTNTLGGGGDYQTTAVSPAPSSLETTETSSSALQVETSSAEAPSPTTVFVTVVVPTAPTATVTQTVYPSPSPDAPETSESTTETVEPTDGYNTAIPTGAIGSPPDLVIPTSMTESFASSPTSEAVQSSSTSAVTSTPIASPTSTSVRSTTTVLQTVTLTSTKEVVFTSYSTVIATTPVAIPDPTQPEIIPVPTDSDILTTVFETQTASAIVTAVPPSDVHSNVPEFGNVISVTMSVSYPVPLFPIPAEPDSTVPVIHTTIQLSSTFQRIGLSTPAPSAPFTYIRTTIPYPYPTQSPDADTSPTSVATSSPPIRTGFVIPGIISRQDISASRAASTFDISNSAAAPTTLSTAIATRSGRTPSAKPRSVYTPVAVDNVKRVAAAQVRQLEARSSAPQNRAAFAPAVLILIAVAFLTSFVA
ncbi:hypothetical protein TWF696_002694 [Orbilia brochopaga]|uniref:Uncharacterized protein n=1 Tax=Orbilia brochopaga TaxID=3140254 RepID=A0AAV9U2P0_9PEZI